jgi:hypothetical protein
VARNNRYTVNLRPTPSVGTGSGRYRRINFDLYVVIR